MTGRTHDAAAFAALSLVVLVQPLEKVSLATLLLSLLANQIGGILPDIDQPTAPFWRNLPIGNIFGKIFGRMVGGHRFLSHSIVGLVIIGFLAQMLLHAVQPILGSVDIGLVWWALMIGTFSHLVADSFTKEGVPWLLPIPIKFGFPPMRRLRITTDSKFERWLVLPGLLLFCAYLYVHNAPKILQFLHQYVV